MLLHVKGCHSSRTPCSFFTGPARARAACPVMGFSLMYMRLCGININKFLVSLEMLIHNVLNVISKYFLEKNGLKDLSVCLYV